MVASMRTTTLLTLAVASYGFDQVLLVRHCVRSMYPTLRGRGDPDFDYANNYTAKPFPTNEVWKATGDGHCTEKGEDIAQSFGKSLLSKNILQSPVTVVSDNISRCITTAEQMTRGLNSASKFKALYHGTTKTLSPSGKLSGLCSPEKFEDRIATMKNMLQLVENGSHYLSAAWQNRSLIMMELQELVGRGDAPSILDIPDKINEHGIYVGGLQVASQGMVENFILEAGAGIPVAWGALDGQPHRRVLWERFSLVNILYNRINHNGDAPATRDGAVVVDILRQLQNSTKQGSLLLVGHDTNVDNVAALLDLTWSCGPYADNESPPHVGLLFERSGDGVDIKVVCTSLDDSDASFPSPGEVLVGQLRRRDLPFATSPITGLLQEAHRTINKWGGSDCIAPILDQIALPVEVFV